MPEEASPLFEPTADTQSTDDTTERPRNPGNGGETHQAPGKGGPAMTTAQGVLISDDQNSLKVGRRGPTLLEDFAFREKIFHFDHERIPERVVHARGYGAHGYFEATDALADLTMAAPFQVKGKRNSGLRAVLDGCRCQRVRRPRP